MNCPGFIGPCGEEVAGDIGDPFGKGALWVSLSLGELAPLTLAGGEAIGLGTSNRPRRCDAVGEVAGDEIGVEVAAAVAVGATVAALRGVITGLGVEVAATVATGVAVAATDGTGVAIVDVDAGDVWELCVVAAVVVSAFTNFFDGAFAGGAASDFIFARVFFASS